MLSSVKYINMKLSVVLATRNEEENIERCLESIKSIANEIIIFDEYSTDRTKEIAEKFGAKVFLEPHHDIFHITKQKAIDMAKGDWILQLDADEVVSPELSMEIQGIINHEVTSSAYNQSPIIKQNKLFDRHQKLIEQRNGPIGKQDGEVVAYFIPRRNMFLGKPLIHAGVYPDGVIRLIRKGKAYLPAKSVHEQMVIDGKVGWLNGDLLHFDSPTLSRYLNRLNRYTDLKAQELKSSKTPKNLWSFLQFTILHPTYYFLLLFIRHLGFLDGVNGFLWSFFSALHFPIAYFKYITNK
ncbi:MAG: glycosyl transferase, group 2 family [uncultured bacterium]|nr:MAG: glycosyl transferase, group 2 family [uncultured bacterium]